MSVKQFVNKTIRSKANALSLSPLVLWDSSLENKEVDKAKHVQNLLEFFACLYLCIKKHYLPS